MTDIYRTFTNAWVHELEQTQNHGLDVSPRGMLTKEREFVQFEIMDPTTFPVRVDGREFRDVIGYLEGLSMVAQTNVPSTFTDRVRNFAQFTDDGIFWGSYGARLHGQIGDLVRRLKADPDTRQGVLTIFDGGRDLAAAKKDIPCTITMQFLLREGALNMRTTMRSNDLWLGTPYDFTQFAMLQLTIAQAVGALPGYYVHSVGSLHLYERDFKAAEKVRFPASPSWKRQHFPLWGADTLEGIVDRASRMLIGESIPDMTDFEAQVWEALG